jgi:hypothetical protein
LGRILLLGRGGLFGLDAFLFVLALLARLFCLFRTARASTGRGVLCARNLALASASACALALTHVDAVGAFSTCCACAAPTSSAQAHNSAPPINHGATFRRSGMAVAVLSKPNFPKTLRIERASLPKRDAGINRGRGNPSCDLHLSGCGFSLILR